MANPVKKVSTLDTWAQQYNVECKCDRQNTAVYFCNDEDCKDKAEKFFCMECIAEDRKHLSHKPIKIQVELKTRFEEWQSLVENNKRLRSIIDVNYKLIHPLVKYLENEDLLKEDINIKAPSQKVS